MAKITTKRKPRKHKVERVHSASAYIAVPSLTKAGSSLWLEIAADNQRIGKLEIGRGAVYWTGRHRKKQVRMSWSWFAAKMDEICYG
jgi:hypothetical protein